MKLSKEYILNNLAREDLWTPGSKGTFTYRDWIITLKREDDLYNPYKFAIEGRKKGLSKAGTYETWSRRYVSMEKAFLHILNHFNENVNVKDKYDHIDIDVLSSIKDLPSVSLKKDNYEWVLTDPDDLQLRRQVQGDNPKVFELMQVDAWPMEEKTSYKLAVGEIDLNDYTEEEIKSTLDSFGYDNMEALLSAVGSEVEAYGQLAEMFFETYTTEYYVCEFDSWNAAVDEVVERTDMDLTWLKEEKPALESVIKSCSEMIKNGKRDITEKGTVNKDER